MDVYLAVPQTGPDGTFLGFIGSAIDVTDQKLAGGCAGRAKRQID
jgi:hypothetical protein